MDLRRLTQDDTGPDALLHLPTVVDVILSDLDGADVGLILREELGLHPDMVGRFGDDEIAFQVMEAATAWVRRRLPAASRETCLAAGQAIGEMAGGDAAMGLPPSADGAKVYQTVCALVERWAGADRPEQTAQVLTAILRAIA